MIDTVEYNKESDTLVIKLDTKLDAVVLERASKVLNRAIMKGLPDESILVHYNNFRDEAEERKLI